MMTRTHHRINALIVDMDNTLYDWVSYFVPAIQAMLNVAARLLNVSDHVLRADLRAVHVAHGNTEHPFALLETRTVRQSLPDLDVKQRHAVLLPAFAAFNTIRDDRLHLYPGVDETLRSIRATGCRVIGHTEATDVNIASRARMLGLSTTLEAIYAPRLANAPHPLGDAAERSPGTGVPIQPLPADARKPNPTIASWIADQTGVPVARCLYVGDSLAKDIAMASDAGMKTAWARYGLHHDPQLWSTLVELSHWDGTSVASAEHRNPSVITATPDVTLNSFPEILDHFAFISPTTTQPAVESGGG